MKSNKSAYVIAFTTFVIFGVLSFGIARTHALIQWNPIIDFSKKTSQITKLSQEFKKNIGTEIPFMNKGQKLEYSKKVIIEAQLGTTNSDFGIEEYEELSGSYTAPGAIAVSTQGDIYINDPVNKAINKYSGAGALTEKITLDEWPFDLGIDKAGNLFVLGKEKVYLKPDGNSELKPLNLLLNMARHLEVMPSGTFMVLDKTGLPDDNLRVRKYDQTGQPIANKEQHNHSLGLYEFEDQAGAPVTLEKLGGGITGLQYHLGHRDRQIVYQPYLPEGYIYNSLQVLGMDNSERLYFLRNVRPDNSDVPTPENFKKLETWVDVINFATGGIESVALDQDTALYGAFRSIHRFRVNAQGDIYQMVITPDLLKVIQYVRHGY